jgi:peptidoglycan/xylan/chitin deacetylase (PgdA/CDA1 family)
MFGKTIFIRFDIDTVTCMEKGVPRLLQLARDLGIKLTFFVNYGKSIDHREILLKTFGRTLKNVTGSGCKISILRKLGITDTVRTFLLNPCVGESRDEYIHRMLDEGHEVGLHGGHNHSVWQRRAHSAAREEIENWLLQTHEKFRTRFGQPAGFASPGGNGSPHAYQILKDLGYRYVSDTMTEKDTFPYFEQHGLLQIPVNGQINQIPLMEHFRAKGLPEKEIVEHALQHIKKCPVKTLVAHPVWEGYRDIALFKKLVVRLLQEGYGFACFKDIYDHVT